MGLVARLKPEVAWEQAQAELTALASQQQLRIRVATRTGVPWCSYDGISLWRLAVAVTAASRGGRLVLLFG